MKIWMKTAMAAALAATIGLGAPLATAGGHYCDGAEGKGERAEWRHGGPGKMKERAEARLSRLEQDLRLQPGQTAAWAELKGLLLSKAEQAQERFKEMREEGPPKTAVERLQRMEEFGREGIEHLTAVRTAAQNFYAGLDDSQKKTFDEGFRFMPLGPGGHGRPMHHRRG